MLYSKEVNKNLLNQAIGNLRWLDIFNNANSTYNYMTNEGFNFIKNDSLRLAITSLNEFDFKRVTHFANLGRNYYENLKLNLFQYGLIHPDFSYELFDLNGLQQDLLFKNHLNNYRYNLFRTKHWYNQTLIALDSLVNQLDQIIFELSGVQYPDVTKVRTQLLRT